MKLVIVSHTEHYLNENNQVVGWGPTVRELNHLITDFDEIVHCAPLYAGAAPPSAMPYTNERIKHVALKPSGGDSMRDKLSVIITAPANLRIVKKALAKADLYQFRAPTGMGVYMIPWLKWFSGKPGWFKYAGNWVQRGAPLGYRVQRFFLKKFKNHFVTINGRWPNQPDHLLTFENPCLTREEISDGNALIKTKVYDAGLNFCFVGRLESAKGVGRILDAFARLNKESRIQALHFVGDGPEREAFEKKSKSLPMRVTFHGFLSRDAVAEVMKCCHVFLLPSLSEGFPKVIAEAVNFGCVPVVSDASSIGQYVRDGENGFLTDHKDSSAQSLVEKLEVLLAHPDLKTLAVKGKRMAAKFSFEYYNRRIQSEILPFL